MSLQFARPELTSVSPPELGSAQFSLVQIWCGGDEVREGVRDEAVPGAEEDDEYEGVQNDALVDGRDRAADKAARHAGHHHGSCANDVAQRTRSSVGCCHLHRVQADAVSRHRLQRAK